MLRASVVRVVAGFALLALAIALGQRLAGGNDPTAQIEVERTPALAPLPPASVDRVTAAPGATSPVAKLGSRQRPDEGSVAVRAATAPPVQLQGLSQSGASEPVIAAAGQTAAMDPAAVIGRQFPVSRSVAAGCKADRGCPELDEELSKFAQEPRDPTWAADMEAKLRDFVMADSGQYTIRNIECRTSLCAIEVASSSGGFVHGVSLNPTLRALLFLGHGAFGIERDPSSAKVVVTLLTFTRR